MWKWFDDRSGKWSNYASSNNKTIDDSYMAGDSLIRLVTADSTPGFRTLMVV